MRGVVAILVAGLVAGAGSTKADIPIPEIGRTTRGLSVEIQSCPEDLTCSTEHEYKMTMEPGQWTETLEFGMDDGVTNAQFIGEQTSSIEYDPNTSVVHVDAVASAEAVGVVNGPGFSSTLGVYGRTHLSLMLAATEPVEVTVSGDLSARLGHGEFVQDDGGSDDFPAAEVSIIVCSRLPPCVTLAELIDREESDEGLHTSVNASAILEPNPFFHYFLASAHVHAQNRATGTVPSTMNPSARFDIAVRMQPVPEPASRLLQLAALVTVGVLGRVSQHRAHAATSWPNRLRLSKHLSRDGS